LQVVQGDWIENSARFVVVTQKCNWSDSLPQCERVWKLYRKIHHTDFQYPFIRSNL